MRTTIDKAGRIVIPRELRAEVGLVPGEVSVTATGAGILIEPIASDELTTKDGRLVLAHPGPELTVERLRDLRLADQR